METINNQNKQLLQSKYAKDVDLNLPLNDYPRPEMMRNDWINLNGKYAYAITKKTEMAVEQYQGEIIVPFCVESSLSQVQKQLNPDETLWYHRQFELKEIIPNHRLLLHFEAVDYLCSVFINNQFVGKNRGGYLPFSFDITNLVKSGINTFDLSVEDPTDTGYQERGKQVLNPKGIWYTSTSGIWQTVWMEFVPIIHFESIKIIPDIDNSSIRICPNINSNGLLSVKIKIYSQSKLILESLIEANNFSEIKILKPILWSPETPHLYDIKLDLMSENQIIDHVDSYFGLRKIHIENDENGYPRIFLNNRIYFQTGVLDQGYFPESLLTPPTDQAMIDDIETVKKLGFNMIRKHIKIEPRRWYYHCDRIGMLVWQDMPNGGEGYIGNAIAVVLPNMGIKFKDNLYRQFHRSNFKGRQEFETHLKSMINHLYNHPSICCWVPFNEGWGQFDANRIGVEIKKIDPSRLVDHASGWHDQKGPDFVSIHRYIFKVKTPKKNNKRPFVLSEFGGYSQIISKHCWDETKSFGYKMFDSKTDLTSAYDLLINQQIMPLIPKGLCATVYTQLSDVELEVNGLLTYDREIIKLDKFVVLELNNKLKYQNTKKTV